MAFRVLTPFLADSERNDLIVQTRGQPASARVGGRLT